MSRLSKNNPNHFFPMPDGQRLAVKKLKPIPHEFVLEAIAPLSPWTRPMFGCLAVYVQEKIVLILRDKEDHASDNGVWLATTEEHHESLRREFPNLRSIRVLGSGVTGWQVLPAGAEDFETAALRACELILSRDSRIGKIPGTKRAAGSKSKRKQKASKRAKKRGKTAGKRSRK